MTRLLRTGRFLAFLGCLLATGITAADDPVVAPPAFPKDPALWMNSAPMTWEQLRGKGVVLVFFECDAEGTAILPKFQECARNHTKDPVVFIGVSVGYTRRYTELFLQDRNYRWPTICDPTNSFAHQWDERLGLAAGDKIVESINAAANVTPGGNASEGWWDDPEPNVEAVLDGAKWTTDPASVPESMRPLWQVVEFRRFSDALPLLKKSLSDKNTENRETAERLKRVIDAEIEQRASDIHSATEVQRDWNAYTGISKLEEEFRGYEIPKDLDLLKKKLMRSPQVKAGQLAERQLPTLTQNLSSPNPAFRKKAQTQLEKIESDFPESDLANRVRKVLDAARKPTP